MANLKRVLWHLLGGTRGGPSRARILRLIRDRPSNTNQIAQALSMDYKTADHHVRVLRENRLLATQGDGYGATHLWTADMEETRADFDQIASKILPINERRPEP